MSHRIRRLRREDMAAVARLAAELGYPASPEAVRRRFEAIAKAGDHRCWVAIDHDIVGWVHACRVLRLESDPFVELGGLVVTASHRRRGIGRDLVRAAAEWARTHGHTRLRVRSRLTRRASHAFFKGLGFSPTKRQQVLDLGLPWEDGPNRGEDGA